MKERWLRARADGIALCVLAAAIAAVSWWGFFTAGLLARLDTVTFYLPWYRYLGLRLRQGELPGWLPWSMSGVPFAGDPQSGWGYVPAMAIFTLFPGKTGFEVLIVFHLLLGAFAAYAFGRVIGLGIAGSTVTGAVFALDGLLERSKCCTIHVEVAVWVPVAFLGVELGARAIGWRGRLGWWGLTGVAASQMIAGWIGQGAVYGLMTVGAYAGYRVLLAPAIARREWRLPLLRFVQWGAITGGLAAVLAATAVLPRLDTIGRSNLAGGSYDAVGGDAAVTGGWTVWELIDRLVTEDNRAGRWYTGAAAVSLALLAPFLARRRYQLPFFLPFTLVVLVLTLNTTPLHRLFYLIPTFRQFHEHRPERILTVFPLGLAVLAGATVVSLTRVRQRTRWFALLGIVPIVLAFAINAWLPVDSTSISAENMAAMVLVSLAVIGVIALPDRRLVYASLALVVAVIVWDPGLRDVVLRHTGQAETERRAVVATYERDDGGAAFLVGLARQGELFRYFGYDPAQLTYGGAQRTYHVSYLDPKTNALLVNNRAVRLGLEDIQGYNPVQIQRYVDYLVALNGDAQSYHAANVLAHGATSPMLDLLNVEYIVVPNEDVTGRPDLFHLSQRYPTVYADAQVRILKRTSALPRAWVVHQVLPIKTEQRVLDLLASGSVDPRQQALIPQAENTPELGVPAAGAGDTVTVHRVTPERIEVNANLAAAGMVVLSEIWDPNWKVTIDGKAAPLYRVDSILRGAVAPAGAHTVVFTYSSRTLVATAAVSGAGWLLVFIGGLALLLQRLGVVGRPRHQHELDRRPLFGMPEARPRPESGALVRANGPPVEGGDRQAKPGWLPFGARKSQHLPDEREAMAPSGEVGP